jgi:hypothetical protein
MPGKMSVQAPVLSLEPFREVVDIRPTNPINIYTGDMTWDENGDRQDLAGGWLGTVLTNRDPEGRGRIKASVDGLFGSEGSFWLWPLLPGAGDKTGLWTVPKEKSMVVVQFSGGRSTERGWYQPVGWFPGGEPAMSPPEESGGDPDVLVLASSRYALVLDPRAENPVASITDRLRGDTLSLSGNDLSIRIHATSRLTLSSDGAVEIVAPLVTINDRSVLPSDSKPI